MSKIKVKSIFFSSTIYYLYRNSSRNFRWVENCIRNFEAFVPGPHLFLSLGKIEGELLKHVSGLSSLVAFFKHPAGSLRQIDLVNSVVGEHPAYLFNGFSMDTHLEVEAETDAWLLLGRDSNTLAMSVWEISTLVGIYLVILLTTWHCSVSPFHGPLPLAAFLS